MISLNCASRNCRHLATGRRSPWLAAVTLLSFAPLAQAADPLDTWHVRTPPEAAAKLDFQGAAFGNGRWVVVGENGIILSSPDGAAWTTEINPAGEAQLDDIAFGNGTFVAIGSGNQVVLTSPNGRDWTKQPLKSGGGLEIIHDGSRFVALAAGGYVSTSVDGVTWDFPARVPTLYVDVGGLAFGNGTYVEAGYKRTGKPTDLWSCTALANWEFREAQVSQNLFGVGYGLGQFIAVGQGGALITSPDGREWTPRTVPHTGFIWDVCAGGPYLAAAGQWGRILTSSNGVDWQKHETGLDWHLTDIAFGNGTFLAVGWDGQIVQSDSLAPSSGDERILLSHPTAYGGEVAFAFTGTLNQTYQVQATTDWNSWTTLANVICTESPMTVVFPSQSGPRRFYRVLKQP